MSIKVHKQLTFAVLPQFHDSKLLLETCGMAKDSYNKIVTLFFLGEPPLHFAPACMLMHVSLSGTFRTAKVCHSPQFDKLLCSLQIDPAKRVLPKFLASHKHWMVPATLPQPF